ncbi:nucleotidyltransferase domain-containing protein [Alloiococcus sp. CFN-8]|uniref:nucleotidyltransferase domain-containing protein n=1 Tax=Alloiococcus sp. CFN-8 TaxID=3416081 RepID=UPI003CF24135
MDINNIRFLDAIKAHTLGEKVYWTEVITFEEWLQLFNVAAIHKVIPMFYEAVYDCTSYKIFKEQLDKIIKVEVQRQVYFQALKTSDFLVLYKHLSDVGIKPLVVKGLICRNIYPMPDHRASGDEDLFIPKEQFNLCHEAMLSYGMQVIDDKSIEDSYEVSYRNRYQYIELHKNLFPEHSEAYGEFNDIFKHVFDNFIEEEIQGVKVRTMEYTDHLMYLICHAFKHFLHSGFGVRQLCDIIVYSNTYGAKINWNRLLEDCRKIKADIFTAALFDIGKKYLGFSPKKACYIEEWRNIYVDSQDLLSEILNSGVYGDSTMSRKHSSNITLNAVISDKKGKKSKFYVLKTVFPDSKSLSGRYSYIKKYPFLLPVAWAQRIFKYKKEISKRGSENSVSESIKIGNDRIELLRKHGIIKK